MMRTARVAEVLVLASILAVGAGCRRGQPPAGDAVDSTRAGAGVDSTSGTALAAPGSDATASAPDTLLLFSCSQRRGMRLFRHYCVVCHGERGAGDGFNAYNLDPHPRDLTDSGYQKAVSDEALTEVLAQGGRGMNKSILMPAYGKTLSADQITDLVAYLRTLPGPEAQSKDAAER